MSKKLSKREYLEILNRLPIRNPTPGDMAAVCPHLTLEQAVEAFNKDSDYETYVACPPLRVDGAFQIISYRKAKAEDPACLCWSYANRILQSYADGKPHGDVFCEYPYVTEAIKFAEENWGDELILDTWESVQEIYVQDPSELGKGWLCDGQPTTKAVLCVTLNRDLNEIINDHSRPTSELFDDAIVEMTIDDKVWHELKGGRGGYIDFNCAYCGSGLGLSVCTGCGHRFKDDHMRCGWETPLSKKMVEFLQQNGHVFKKDPQIAWNTEREWHEKRKKSVADRNAELRLNSRKRLREEA